ncbi:kinase-like domain-containing protein [Biscogniauxia marginata]|nr:kinase-like domain-containing protein [Biscogniauxia marginata]
MAPYDAIAKRNAYDGCFAFARKLIDASGDIISFVDKHLGWNGAGRYDGLLGGSFNISLKVKRGDSDQHVIVRFPYSGKIHGPWREEKVKNEVMAMDYVREHTNIPVPRVHCWGLTKESPGQLGPFIIMDFVEGQNLGRFLAPPTEDKTKLVFLDPNVDDATLDTIYEQIASFMLELSRLKFPRIGEWAVTGRPLTYDMNEVVTVGSCPAEHFAAMGPFDRATDYFGACAQYFQTHLEAQRNIAGDDEDVAWSQFVARRCFAGLIPAYGTVDNDGPFQLFCDDLRPTNMLVDPKTLRITAVFDLEFTNIMPAQFTYDVPWWLLLQPPAVWLRDNEMEKFLRLFRPRNDQFIRAMERAEAKSSLPAGEPCLSARMRDSWDTRRFWFNLASRCSFDVDDFYWQALHKTGLGEAMLDSVTLAEKERFLKQKMLQVEEYCKEKESDERFAEE